MKTNMAATSNTMLNVLELYSGIGGMHFALKGTKLQYRVVRAMDINTNANKVYHHNFPDVVIEDSAIEALTLKTFESLAIDMILMSPPCQPFTRVGKQQDVNDVRTKSFLHILDLIKQASQCPRYILLENVMGFEGSESRNRLIQTLQHRQYSYQEFLLTPLQFGIPNSRLRYFLIAKAPPLTFAFTTTQQIQREVPELAKNWLKHKLEAETLQVGQGHLNDSSQGHKFKCQGHCSVSMDTNEDKQGKGSLKQMDREFQTDNIDEGIVSGQKRKCIDGDLDENMGADRAKRRLVQNSGSETKMIKSEHETLASDNKIDTDLNNELGKNSTECDVSQKQCDKSNNDNVKGSSNCDKLSKDSDKGRSVCNENYDRGSREQINDSSNKESSNKGNGDKGNNDKGNDESSKSSNDEESCYKGNDVKGSCNKDNSNKGSSVENEYSNKCNEDKGSSNKDSNNKGSSVENDNSSRESNSGRSECLQDYGTNMRQSNLKDHPSHHPCLPIHHFLEQNYLQTQEFQEYLIKEKDFKRFMIMDIVNPCSRKSTCFTKRYGHFVDGAGSVVQMCRDTEMIEQASSLKDRTVEKQDRDEWGNKELDIVGSLQLRYFTPREIANVLCFPQHFDFPDNLTNRQKFMLLGNSLNVHMVSVLLCMLTEGDR